MRTVSRFESNLLQILRGIFRSTARRKMLRLLNQPSEQPKCLSGDAVFLIEDTLSKGAIETLATLGGWRNESFLRNGERHSGRLWNRIPIDERSLTFSEDSLRFLLCLTATEFSNETVRETFRFEPRLQLTTGDQLLFFWAYESVRESAAGEHWRGWQLFVSNPFCRLIFPEDFGEAIGLSCNFEQQFETSSAFVWEALLPQIANRWMSIERAKFTNTSAAEVRSIGQSQIFTARQFFESASASGRRDLTRWFFETTRLFFADNPPTDQWTNHLNVQGLRMADRVETYRGALSLAQLFGDIDRWQADARAIGYLHEDYRAAQFWLEMWEQFNGDMLSSTAKRLVRSVDPIS